MTVRKKVLYASNIALLNPVDCGSSVAYTITSGYKKGSVDGAVTLYDCDRKINWNFYTRDQHELEAGLKKIDKAMGMLAEFRGELVAAARRARR